MAKPGIVAPKKVVESSVLRSLVILVRKPAVGSGVRGAPPGKSDDEVSPETYTSPAVFNATQNPWELPVIPPR
jgi:hypothetical protein